MAQIALSAGSSTSVSITAGNWLLISGSGTYRVGPLGTSQRPSVDQLIDETTVVGPFSDVCPVTIFATGGGAAYEMVAPTDAVGFNGKPAAVSGAGIPLSSNLESAAANAAAIQRALDAGGVVRLAGAGVAWIDRTLLIGSNTELVLDESLTIKLVGGLTNTPMLRNADMVNGNANIIVRGGAWDGNGPNQTRSDGATFSAFCLLFVRVSNLKLRDFRLTEPRAWGLTASLVSNFTFENIHLDYSNANLANQDGIHLVGCKDGTVRRIYGHTYDDMVAIVNEDYGVYADAVPPGPSSNILIEDVKANSLGAYRHVRILDSTQYPAIGVTVRHLRGPYLIGGVFIGSISGKTSWCQNILIDDVDIAPRTSAAITPTIELNGSFYSLRLRNIKRLIRSTETPLPVIGVTNGTLVLRDLHIDGLDVYDESASGSATNYIDFDTSGTYSGTQVYNYSISNVTAQRSTAAGIAANLHRIGRANVHRFHAHNVNTQRISRFAIFDSALGQCSKKLSISQFQFENNSAPFIETTAAVVSLPLIQLSTGQLSGTQAGASGSIRFGGLNGTCLVEIQGCDLANPGQPAIARAGSESIRARSLSTAILPSVLTPVRGDMILNASANNDPYRWDGAAWTAI